MASSRSVPNCLLFWYLLSFLCTGAVNCLPLDSESDCIMTPSFETPSYFRVGENPVLAKTITRRLSTNDTQQACKLNVQSLLKQSLKEPGIFNFVFNVICSNSLRVHFYLPKNFTYFHHINSSHLYVSGFCEISIKDLVVFSAATAIKALALVDGVHVREESIDWTVSHDRLTAKVKRLYLSSLSSNGIPSMFTKFTWREMVDVYLVNMSLTSIPDALKKYMPHVQSLQISYNHLTKLPNFPWPRRNLKLFDVIGRPSIMDVTKLYILSPSDTNETPRILSVEFNPGLNLTECKLPARSLAKVSLRDNGLRNINPAIFDEVKDLKAIDLSKNKLKDIPAQIFKQTKTLVNINLANNNLESFDPGTFQELQQLRRLDLSNNNIHTLQNGLLSGSMSLEEIYLQNNSLKQIESGALPFGNNCLKRINLQDNNLHNIPMAAFYEKELTVFDISDNNVDHSRFIETLTSLDMRKFVSSHPTLAESLTGPRIHAKIFFKIRRNKIKQFFGTYFNETMLSKLKLIFRIYTLDIKDNPLMCDCTMVDFQSKIKRLITSDERIDDIHFDSWLCHSPDDVRGKKMLSIPPEHLKCEIHTEKCPAPCKCYRRLSGLPSIVDCRSLGLTKLPNNIPGGLVEIRLEHNKIRHLDFTSHNYLRNVTSLHLGNNSLQEITLRSSLPFEMKEIYLDSNRLSALPKDFEKFNLSNINIQDNVFKCDCNNRWMKTWLRQLGNALDGGESSVLCSSGKHHGRPLLSVPDIDFVCSIPQAPDTNLLTIVACILGGLMGTFILATVVYRLRMELKLVLFTRLNWHPFDRVDDSDPSMIYDAFVSYNSRDFPWVAHTLKEQLEGENPPYKLCIHDRDFLVGAPIFQNIFDSMKTSRRMIMVLSNNFIQSEWCMLEFRAAHQKVIEDRNNYLIIVLFHDVDAKNLDDELKLYLRTNTYLDINNKWFWEKLKYALPQERLETSQTQSTAEGQVDNENETSF